MYFIAGHRIAASCRLERFSIGDYAHRESARVSIKGQNVLWRFGRSRWRGGRYRVFEGRQFVWDEASARLQVIICVCGRTQISTELAVRVPKGDEMAKRPLNPHTYIFI